MGVPLSPLSGRAYLRKITEWQKIGYHVKLIFLSLPSSDFAIARVAARVAQGGHDIPVEVIRRRFHIGLDNFERLYRPVVDAWSLYDGAANPPVKIEWGEK